MINSCAVRGRGVGPLVALVRHCYSSDAAVQQQDQQKSGLETAREPLQAEAAKESTVLYVTG